MSTNRREHIDSGDNVPILAAAVVYEVHGIAHIVRPVGTSKHTDEENRYKHREKESLELLEQFKKINRGSEASFLWDVCSNFQRAPSTSLGVNPTSSYVNQGDKHKKVRSPLLTRDARRRQYVNFTEHHSSYT